MDDLALADELSRLAGVPVPEAVSSLRGARIRHTRVCGRDEMAGEVCRFLGLG